MERKSKVVYRRGVNEVWVNQYSKQLLTCWNANLDISFVTDAYAVVIYIREREIGLLLSNAQKEVTKQGNLSAKEAKQCIFTRQGCLCPGGGVQANKHASEGVFQKGCVCAHREQHSEDEITPQCFEAESGLQ